MYDTLRGMLCVAIIMSVIITYWWFFAIVASISIFVISTKRYLRELKKIRDK